MKKLYPRVGLAAAFVAISAMIPTAIPWSDEVTAERPTYFVAPNGNDGWSGTLPTPREDGLDGPFLSLYRAYTALTERSELTSGVPQPATIYIRQGIYYFDRPLEITGFASGDPGNPVRITNYGNETVRLVGGRRLREIKRRDDGIWEADASVVTLPNEQITQLYVDGQRMEPARYPNRGTGNLPGGGWLLVAGAVSEKPKQAFRFAGDRPTRWAKPQEILVSIFPNYNWWHAITEVTQLDATSKIVTLAEELPYTIEPGRRYYFLNVAEELDAPGEFYHDTAAGKILFIPPNNAEPKEVIVPYTDTIFSLQGVQHFSLTGLTIEMARGDAVVIKDGLDVFVGKCTIRNTGGNGVTVQGGQGVQLRGNDIYHTGKGGVQVEGGDRKTLTSSQHEVVNNHIYRFSERIKTYTPGVRLGGVGVKVTNNLIHDAPHCGILLNGNEHRIEYNEIYDVCQETGDCGAFYMGRDWTERGNLIQYNRFHDVYGFGLAGTGEASDEYVYVSPYQAWGIYLDDCASGTKVIGNFLYRIPLCGVMIGGGKDNKIYNNFIIDCIPALHIDARWQEFPYDILIDRLNAMNYKEPPYSNMYPELESVLIEPRKPTGNEFCNNVIAYKRDDYVGLTSMEPHPGSAAVYDLDNFDPGTVFKNNAIHHYNIPVRVRFKPFEKPSAGTISWQEWVTRGFDTDSVITDPMFSAPTEDDYRLRFDSPLLPRKIQNPPGNIGLFQDEFRASPPPPREPRKETVEHRVYRVRVEE